MTLKHYNGRWIIVVMVEHPESMSKKRWPRVKLPVEFWYGSFDEDAKDNGDESGGCYHDEIMSGASIGDASRTSGCQTAGTLGGFIQGTTTGRIIRVTTGHLFFDSRSRKTTSLDQRNVPRKVVHPAFSDSDGSSKENLDVMDVTFGTAVYACSDPYVDDDASTESLMVGRKLRMKDLAFTVPGPKRSCTNRYSVTSVDARFRFVSCCQGFGSWKIEKYVMKVGKETGCTIGRISKAYDMFYCKELAGIVMNTVASGDGQTLCAIGDSGSFEVNSRGRVVGMAVGGLSGRDPKASVHSTAWSLHQLGRFSNGPKRNLGKVS
jgi:hypothetical protein